MFTDPLQPAGATPRPEPSPTARAPVRGRVVSGPRSNRPGFTLAEILIAIILIVIVGGLAVTNFSNLTSGLRKQPVDEVLTAAVREARYQAVLNKRSTLLGYDADQNAFVITDYLTGNTIIQFPLTPDPQGNKVEIKFEPILPLKDLTSSYADAPPQFANTTLTQLMFHPSGASAPVKVDLKINDKETTMFLDPFSEGPTPKPVLP